jgi:hypothetical protein
MENNNSMKKELVIGALIIILFSHNFHGMELGTPGSETKKAISGLTSIIIKHPVATGAALCVGAGCAATFAYYWNKQRKTKPTEPISNTLNLEKKADISLYNQIPSLLSMSSYVWNNTGYAIRRATSWFSAIPYRYFGADETNEQMITLKHEQLQKLNTTLSKVTDDSLNRLYKWTGANAPLLSISHEELSALNDEPNNLKKLFEKNHITTAGYFFDPEDWANEEWSNALKVLKERAENKEELLLSYRKKIDLHALPELLLDEKFIIKSFLPTYEITFLKPLFIEKKQALGRLLTYARLHKAIKDKKLSHVRLPLKILLVKDKKTEKYVSNQEASRILDDIIKIFAIGPAIEIKIAQDFEAYHLQVFAEKQIPHKVPLSEIALTELKILVKEAPFDVGYDNIFSDSKGDAIIIDTEFNGESAENSVIKLKRYRKK